MALGNSPMAKVCGFHSITAKENKDVKAATLFGLATSMAEVNRIFSDKMKSAWPEDWLFCFEMNGKPIGGCKEANTWFASQAQAS